MPTLLNALTTIGSWIVTYAVHSTVLLAAVWIACSLLRSRRLDLQELLWRSALLGGVLTATLQVGLGVQPAAGTVHLGQTKAPAAATVADQHRAVVAPPQIRVAARAAEVRLAERTAAAGRSIPALSDTWPALLALVWLLGAAVAMTRLTRSAHGLHRLLADRRPLVEGPMPALLDRLRASMGLRRRVLLSSSDALPIPFATGVHRPEICVPADVLHRMSASHQESLLAHELAHVARRDPAWLLLWRVLTGLLFFQPLNLIAVRRLTDLSECLSDDRAAACTGRRHDLARCLVELASRLQPAPRPALLAAALPTRSRLGRRVSRLLTTPEGEGRCARWAAPAVVVGLVAAAAVLPIVAPAQVATAGVSVLSTNSGADPSIDLRADGPSASTNRSLPAPQETEQPATPATAEDPQPPDTPEPPADRHGHRVIVNLDDLDPEAAARISELAERISAQVEAQAPKIEELAQRLGERFELDEEQERLIEQRSQQLAQEITQLVDQILERIRDGEHLDNLDQQYESLGERINQITSELEALTGNLQPSDAEIEQLEAEVEALTETITASNLAELEELVEEIEINIEINGEEIGEMVEQTMEQVEIALEQAFDTAEEDDE